MCKRMLIQTGRLAFPEKSTIFAPDEFQGEQLLTTQLTEFAEEMIRSLGEEPLEVTKEALTDGAERISLKGESKPLTRASTNGSGEMLNFDGFRSLFATAAERVQAEEAYVARQLNRFEELKAEQESNQEVDQISEGMSGSSDSLGTLRDTQYDNSIRSSKALSRRISTSRSTIAKSVSPSEAPIRNNLLRKASRLTVGYEESDPYVEAQKELQERMLMVTRKLQATKLRDSKRGLHRSSLHRECGPGIRRRLHEHHSLSAEPTPLSEITDLAKSALAVASQRRREACEPAVHSPKYSARAARVDGNESDRGVFLTLSSSESDDSPSDEASSSSSHSETPSEAGSSEPTSDVTINLEEVGKRLLTELGDETLTVWALEDLLAGMNVDSTTD